MTGDELTSDTMMYSSKSDMWMASKVRMLYRTDLDHEATVTGARDRIVFLSQELHKARLRLANVRKLVEDLKSYVDHECFDTSEVAEWLANNDVSYSCRENDIKVSREALEHLKSNVVRITEENGNMDSKQILTLIEDIIKVNN